MTTLGDGFYNEGEVITATERICPVCGKAAAQLAWSPADAVHWIAPCGDVVKVTELPGGGLLVEAHPDYGPGGTRKVTAEPDGGLWTPGS